MPRDEWGNQDQDESVSLMMKLALLINLYTQLQTCLTLLSREDDTESLPNMIAIINMVVLLSNTIFLTASMADARTGLLGSWVVSRPNALWGIVQRGATFAYGGSHVSSTLMLLAQAFSAAASGNMQRRYIAAMQDETTHRYHLFSELEQRVDDRFGLNANVKDDASYRR